LEIRLMTAEDIGPITAIYKQSISESSTCLLWTADEISAWPHSSYPALVAETEGQVAAFAASFAFGDGKAFEHIAEVTAAVERRYRGEGLAGLITSALVHRAAYSGFSKLTARFPVESVICRRLAYALGFMDVGVHWNHVKLNGMWRDILVVEHLLDIGRPDARSLQSKLMEWSTPSDLGCRVIWR
jgi:phosphinothricin acetyltransferase